MKNIKDLHYELCFEPDLENFIFIAKETITFYAESPLSKITLNSADLEIRNCILKLNSKKFNLKYRLDKEEEELTINFPEKISGKISIYFEFLGSHNDQLIGFYRSRYSHAGKDKYLVTTQFEAADARRAFVCFDEPEAKATFCISILASKGLTAISNMPVAKQAKSGTKIKYDFETTPKMSTYLVYMAVGEFEYIEDDSGKTNIRVYTTPGKKDTGKFSLEIGRKFLDYYESYFRIPYPLPKMDLIAIPDFAAGAMENWGAITFRENALLFDQKFSTSATKQRVAEVVAHEIAHQWFGNLVTMRWWNDLWLNESFATFMAAKAVDNVFPEFDFWSEFLADSTEAALSLDSMKSSHPIEAKVRTPKEIAEIFDGISYDKGGNILRMLEDFLGEKKFVEGVKLYLETHKYSNTESADLWKAWEEVSKKPVIRILSTWVKKIGYPLVEAKQEGERLVLTQKRFLLENDESDDTIWMIPVSLDADGENTKFLMETKKLQLNDEKKRYIKLNSGQTGFYRVRYESSNLENLRENLGKLGNADRWGVQNDLFALCESGNETMKKYLSMVDSYGKEEDYLVCSDIESSLYQLYLLSSKEKFSEKIRDANLNFLYSNLRRLGWLPKKEEKHSQSILRAKTISLLVKTDDRKTIEECSRLFKSYLAKKDSVSPDIQLPVFMGAAWSGDASTFKTFIRLYDEAQTYEEKIRFLAAISGFRDRNILKMTTDFILSDKIRSSDMFYPINYLSANPYAKDLLWPFARDNWKALSDRLGETKMLLRRVVGALKILSDRESEKEIISFFEKNSRKGIEMALAQTLERIRINYKLLERMRKEF